MPEFFREWLKSLLRDQAKEIAIYIDEAESVDDINEVLNESHPGIWDEI